ncbi:hypothetical protein GCM10010399_00670 [Dactylosporangium fulvum]|uniref:Uncharacterized protein n=1 Tax=Dactylosporangium fulvum TaxID=53359 RepID=A0ABY5VR68_9ACTN|nr:hypothetical protein [Dactylosporangium fulvum]UWP79629.1 hypothetical protein Dfulv_31265 [Dactylosporangium fulvum]
MDKKQAGDVAFNNLPAHVSGMVKRLMGILPSAGALITQPVFTAVAAIQRDGRPLELRLAIHEPPLDKLGQVLPAPGEGNYLADPALAEYRRAMRQYGGTATVDKLPFVGEPRVNTGWTVTAYDPAKGYLLVVSASPGSRAEQFAPDVPDATMVRVLDNAYRLAATKANTMLGARFHVA